MNHLRFYLIMFVIGAMLGFAHAWYTDDGQPRPPRLPVFYSYAWEA